jgi:hypothetical protein
MISHNSALEQTAATSRSWQRAQDAQRKAPARQERSVPPLLTAGVRPSESRPSHRGDAAIALVLLLCLVPLGLGCVAEKTRSTVHVIGTFSESEVYLYGNDEPSPYTLAMTDSVLLINGVQIFPALRSQPDRPTHRPEAASKPAKRFWPFSEPEGQGAPVSRHDLVAQEARLDSTLLAEGCLMIVTSVAGLIAPNRPTLKAAIHEEIRAARASDSVSVEPHHWRGSYISPYAAREFRSPLKLEREDTGR